MNQNFNSVIIVAGGSGSRMKSEIPKQFLPIANRPLLIYCLEAFEASSKINEMILVLPEDWISYFEEKILPLGTLSKLTQIVAGGKTRQESTLNGFRVIHPDSKVILVHDGARPFINSQVIDACIEKAIEKGAAIAAVPAIDTIKEVREKGEIVKTHERSNMYLAQTPQAFQRKILERALQKADEDHFIGTDESSLVERLGEKVFIVESPSTNLKVTHPIDFKIAEQILSELRGVSQ